ncbi:phospholipase D family protein [Nitratireductor sp. L1-7-SE]|uniref:Phospholipase D family protein n=1 Tax=Nitratireductor rhodophyticola TaxID=2854036 RepID=A0ABS7R5L4_9HYPH|nr:phospholipase D family protein [Nitratireductor rhodophyticola]MBY8916214.1 phospholipase D family protein [Nitratireductor rhodophyticola]MBY8921577.1 phospholipase D family protein [Nitratireductor rhodophyticola]
MPDFVDGTQLLEQLRTEYLRTQRADLAVAFWGINALENLGLRNGTGVRIVCNLLSGGTNPNEIRALRRIGADVRQLNDLHAKIGIVGDISFMGSSNMSANGLGMEGQPALWREANVVYGDARPEIVRMFKTFWDAATEINEADLEAAAAAWKTRQEGNAAVAARRGGRSLVDVLRTAPAELDALNVRMVVYDTVTDADELAVLDNAEESARSQYGQSFGVYWDWESMTTDAATAYLVDYDWPARGVIARGMLYRRNASDFPDFEQDGETFHVAYEIDNIEGITFGSADKTAIRRAFHAYVHAGAPKEEGGRRSYNFPISELAPHLEVV